MWDGVQVGRRFTPEASYHVLSFLTKAVGIRHAMKEVAYG